MCVSFRALRTHMEVWASASRDAIDLRLTRLTAHSITSSARASGIGGTSRPSALAVVRFTTRSNLVGCSTGCGANRICLDRRQLIHRDEPLDDCGTMANVAVGDRVLGE